MVVVVGVGGDIEDIIIGDIDKATKVTPPVDDASPSSMPVHPLAKFLDLEDVVGDTDEDTEKQTTKKSMRRVSKYIVCGILLSAPLLTILWATVVSRQGDGMAFPIIVADDDTTWAETTYQLQAQGFSKPRLQYDGNNGIPEAVFPLGLCRGDCDTDKECGVSIVLLNLMVDTLDVIVKC